MARVAGVVPSAGASRRMGSSKALLDAGGRTFVERAVATLSRGGCHPVLAVVRDERGREAEAARRAGARIVVNPAPEEGPISSLRAALDALEGEDVDGVAFLPVDHPLVHGATVETLLAAFADGGALAVLPTHDGRHGHPVVLARDLFDELREPGLEEGARTVLHRHAGRLREVVVDDRGVLADIDDPDDYRAWVDARGPRGTRGPR